MTSNAYTDSWLGGVRIEAHFNKTTIGFGVCISGRKYLNWCTPFSDVSQCIGLSNLNIHAVWVK